MLSILLFLVICKRYDLKVKPIRTPLGAVSTGESISPIHPPPISCDREAEAVYSPPNVAEEFRKIIIQKCSNQFDSVLDLGCGDGRLSIPYLLQGAKITCCDLYNHLDIKHPDVKFVEGIHNVSGRYDICVTNPPFYRKREFFRVAVNSSDHIFGMVGRNVIAEDRRGEIPDDSQVEWSRKWFNDHGYSFQECSEQIFPLPATKAFHKKKVRDMHVCLFYAVKRDNPKDLDHPLTTPEYVLPTSDNQETAGTFTCRAHVHTCTKCRCQYQHTHASPQSKHRDYCPNSLCENYNRYGIYLPEILDSDVHHSHKCDKCGGIYSHDHKYRNPGHSQFGYQCPYKSCEWYFGRSDNWKDRTNPTASRCLLQERLRAPAELPTRKEAQQPPKLPPAKVKRRTMLF